VFVLHVGLDLSRKQVEVCLISDQGELIDRFAVTPDRDGLYGLARRLAVYGEPIRRGSPAVTAHAVGATIATVAKEWPAQAPAELCSAAEAMAGRNTR
jgi:hypothetical protein